MQVALVLWDGNVGGAEKVTAELAGALRRDAVAATVVFVRDPGSLGADLERLGVPYASLGAKRVEEVMWRPRRFARLVEAHGRDGALLPAVGHQAPALRIGGYRAPLVAMEHGFLALIDSMAPHWRIARRLERRLSAPCVDAEVAVSASMRRRVLQAPHARRVELIENGIDVARFPPKEQPDRDGCVFACASRLVPGKGLPELLDAFAGVADRDPRMRLRIAGDGPMRTAVKDLIHRHGLDERVEMTGVVHDMPAFWAGADVAVMPSTAPESFGMVALEAMAARRPVVATRNGGADAVVEDGVTGQLVPCGDPRALADAMLAYSSDPALRRAHGTAGRARCESHFTIGRCAARYARLLADIGGRGATVPAPAEAPLEEVNA